MVLIRFMFIFFGIILFLLKDRIPFMLIFSNRSFILLTLKRRFLIQVKAWHSMWKCLTIQGVWHVIHWSCCSCLSIKKCVSYMLPMHNQDIVIFSFLDFLNAHLSSPNVGLIKKSLLWMLLFQHFTILYEWIYSFQVSSQYIESWIGVQVIWIQSFLSPRLVATIRLKSTVCPTICP